MKNAMWCLAAVCCSSFVYAQEPVEISATEVMQHRLSAHVLHSEQVEKDFWPGLAYVELELIVGTDGTVLKAEPLQGDSRFYSQALEEAFRWKYQPFLRNGRPVVAAFADGARVLGPEKPLLKHVPFPDIKDWDSLRMRLRRSGCFGTCPAYTLEIRGDGTTIYIGQSDTKYCGEWRGTISQSSVREILSLFRSADYFSLNLQYYDWNISDGSEYATSIEFDDQKMGVTDYEGLELGMPTAVVDLENGIDRIAGPDQWPKRIPVHAIKECPGPIARQLSAPK